MLEYDIDDAQSLLEKNLSTASRNLDSLEEDLDFLRDQFTTTEVSILHWGGPVWVGEAWTVGLWLWWVILGRGGQDSLNLQPNWIGVCCGVHH